MPMKKRKGKLNSTAKGLMGVGTIVLHIAKFLLGAAFLFSGFVKAVDPLGTVYKIEEYFTAFGDFWMQFYSLATPVAVLLIVSEWLIGAALFFQFKFKPAVWIAFLFMLFMTPLTLYIAIFNPVTDCGCFGDAVKLTNWETFYKNIVLILFSIVLLIFRKRFNTVYLPKVDWVLTAFFSLSLVAFMMYNWMYLPVIDFRPYKVGVHIPSAMTIPEGKPTDVYEYSFIYEKDGQQKAFPLEALPDSTWVFVAQNSRLISKGYVPPITNFKVLTVKGEDVTHELLDFPGTTYVFILWNLEQANKRGIEKMQQFLREHKRDDVRYFVLTASNISTIDTFETQYALNIPYYQADPITLKTIIRANPGIVVLEQGTIVDKMSWRKLNKK